MCNNTATTKTTTIVIIITIIVLSFGHRFVYPFARDKIVIESIPNLSDAFTEMTLRDRRPRRRVMDTIVQTWPPINTTYQHLDPVTVSHPRAKRAGCLAYSKHLEGLQAALNPASTRWVGRLTHTSLPLPLPLPRFITPLQAHCLSGAGNLLLITLLFTRAFINNKERNGININ